MEALFEFLFKYRPVVFERGAFAFGAGRSALVATVIVVAAALIAVATYRGVRVHGGRRDRITLTALRLAALAVVLVCLFRPMVVLSAAVPQRNVVGILIDDSQSMRIADVEGRARASVVRHLVGGGDSVLSSALSDKFILRYFRLSGGGTRADDPGNLAFDGARTKIGEGLIGAASELAGAPLSGLVLVSDGADNSLASLNEPLLSLRARGVPVYTVGIGKERFTQDIEIARVEAPRSVLKDASLVIDVTIAQRGYAGKPAQLVVEDGGRIVTTKSFTLPADGAPIPVRVRVPTTEPGARTFTFKIAPEAGEQVTQNNSRDALVMVSDAKERILYIEGEPRFELKFLRRAVAEDLNLQLVTLQRTAENKYLRMSVTDSLELIAGFPRTREELFKYRGVILGSIEASTFTLDQLRMLADFVSERGGGLLALGGRKALAEGGYAGTPLADVLPVELTDPKASPEPFFADLAVSVTPAGSTHPATQIAATEDSSRVRWKTLPVVTSVNRIGTAKPGATTLLAGADEKRGVRQIVLAFQRFGRGKSIVFPIQDSWMWQMHATIPVEDMTHEFLWRQLLRWLVSDVPGRVSGALAIDQVSPGEAVEIHGEVLDPSFLKVNSADVVARVRSPNGTETQLPLDWTVTRDGEYRAVITPTEKGLHEIQLRARVGRDTLVSDPVYLQSRDATAEFFGAEMNASVLRRIAEETGGRFYTADKAAELPKDIVFTASGNVVLERMDLWDMPVIYLLLLGLLASEWGYRRVRGLV